MTPWLGTPFSDYENDEEIMAYLNSLEQVPTDYVPNAEYSGKSPELFSEVVNGLIVGGMDGKDAVKLVSKLVQSVSS